MKHGRNLDDVVPEPIHDSVVPINDLAERLVANLWYHPPGTRAVLQERYSGDDPFNDEVGVVRGIAGYLHPDRFYVVDRLGCPDNSSHRRSRRFASL